MYANAYMEGVPNAHKACTIGHMSKSAYPDAPRIGRRARERRTALGLEQREVAARADVSRAYVSRLERGIVAAPTVAELSKVAGALGYSLSELVSTEPSGAAPGLREELAKLFGPDRADEAEAALRDVARKPEHDQRLILRLLRLQASDWLDGDGQSSENGNA